MFVATECAKKSLTEPVRWDSYAAPANNFLFIMTESREMFPDGFIQVGLWGHGWGMGKEVGCLQMQLLIRQV